MPLGMLPRQPGRDSMDLKGTHYPVHPSNPLLALTGSAHPPGRSAQARCRTMATGSSSLRTMTFGSVMFCIIYTCAKIKCSALQWTGTGESRFKSPSKGFSAWKCSTSKSLSCTSVYLCLPFCLQFTLLLPSPSPICLIRFYFIPAHIWP